MIERAAAAREAGLDSLFVGDHHATPEAYYQNTPMMGRLLAEWGDAPFGCLFLLPLWHPVLLAEQVGTLASITKGRFILQAGQGYGAQQFAAMGASMKTRPSAFEESFDAVKRLLAGETVSASGRFTFEGASIAPIPPEPVEYWIAASAPVAIERAARLADGWLAAPGATPSEAWEQKATYWSASVAAGTTPAAIAIRRDIYVGESAADVEEVAGRLVAGGYRGIDPSALVYGTVDEVVARFQELEAMGYTDVIVRHMAVPQEKVLGSMRRLGEVRRAVSRTS
jgi:alkanesulfonate monooxygenase SsuD/methylene tetrahydromethanopterin reductase-like flavin-dependent oxidoreductase (luciferase family)